jgi:hypothetical protein
MPARWRTSSLLEFVPGVDQVRIKEDETNLMRPDAGHSADEWKHPCHYLWRGPLYVKHNGDVYPCCQSYMLDGKPVGYRRAAAARDLQLPRCSACAACTSTGEPGDRYLRALLYDDSTSRVSSRKLVAARQDGAAVAPLSGAGRVLIEVTRALTTPTQASNSPARQAE